MIEQLTDRLVGSTYYHKSEELIKRKDYLKILSDFNEIKSFWGKACFILFLKLHKNKAISVISGKLLRRLKSQEEAVYKRHIEPLYKEISRLEFTNNSGEKISEKVMDRLTEYGEREFTILCRVIFSSGGVKYLDNMLNLVSFTPKMLEEIKQKY